MRRLAASSAFYVIAPATLQAWAISLARHGHTTVPAARAAGVLSLVAAAAAAWGIVRALWRRAPQWHGGKLVVLAGILAVVASVGRGALHQFDGDVDPTFAPLMVAQVVWDLSGIATAGVLFFAVPWAWLTARERRRR